MTKPVLECVLTPMTNYLTTKSMVLMWYRCNTVVETSNVWLQLQICNCSGLDPRALKSKILEWLQNLKMCVNDDKRELFLLMKCDWIRGLRHKCSTVINLIFSGSVLIGLVSLIGRCTIINIKWYENIIWVRFCFDIINNAICHD